VSLRETDLVAVLRWMRPGARIVMGPASFVEGL
jgi:L,D-peptidoglycan transpeptidase YkuD (ErfK/YbiS/YcfS/YnhG family)